MTKQNKQKQCTCAADSLRNSVGPIPCWVMRLSIGTVITVVAVILVGCVIIRYPYCFDSSMELLPSNEVVVGHIMMPPTVDKYIKCGETVYVRIMGGNDFEIVRIKGVITNTINKIDSLGNVSYSVFLQLSDRNDANKISQAGFVRDVEVTIKGERLIERVKSRLSKAKMNIN